MAITKDHLIESIRNRLGVSKFEPFRLAEIVLETIKTYLSSGEFFLIKGFGKFIVSQKAGRRGRNPAIGEDLPLDPRIVITFKCSPVMSGRISGMG